MTVLRFIQSSPPHISTHTPLAGRDWIKKTLLFVMWNFYSHAPCGTWPNRADVICLNTLFLLTRPLRDVTCQMEKAAVTDLISTHTPLAGRDSVIWIVRMYHIISTHTPLAGRDTAEDILKSSPNNFYSHAPCGTWRSIDVMDRYGFTISTHTPLAGRDAMRTWTERK